MCHIQGVGEVGTQLNADILSAAAKQVVTS